MSGSGERKEHTSFPKNKIKVLLLEKISKCAVDAFVQEGFIVETYDKLSEDELVEKIKDVHVIGVRSKTKITKRVIDAAPRLLAIGCFCIGTDQTDLEYAASKGVAVFNSPFSNTRSVAELVLAEMICLARQLPDRSRECHNKIWNKNSSNCYEVRGKTVGIIGYGHVGSQLSILAESLGMHVIYYDIVPKLPLGNAKRCNSMEDLLQQSDFVTLHVPYTPETHHLIGEDQLKLMKKGSYLLNASRGHVVDVPPVAAALKSGYLNGAAFDVFPYEPAGKDEEFNSELQGCPNTILTPHIGGSTEEAQYAIGEEVAQKLITYINTGNSISSVNFPEIALPPCSSCAKSRPHRILNIHMNVPGVLKNINHIVADYNVIAQTLMTRGPIGYLMIEVDSEVSVEIKQKMSSLPTSIRTRILY